MNHNAIPSQASSLSILTVSLAITMSPSLSWGAHQEPMGATASRAPAKPIISESEFVARLNVEKMNPGLRLETTVRAAGVMTEILAKWNPQIPKQDIFSGLLKGIRNEGIENGLIAPALQLIDTSMAIGDTKTAAATNLAIASVNPALTSFIADRLDLPYSNYFASNTVTDESFEKHVTKLVGQAGFKPEQFVLGAKQNENAKPNHDLSEVILGPGSKTAKWEEAKKTDDAKTPQAKDIKFSQTELAGKGTGPLSGQTAESCEATCKDKGMTSFIRDSIAIAGLTAVASSEFTPIGGAIVAVVGEAWAFNTAVNEYNQCVQKECSVNGPQTNTGSENSISSPAPAQPSQNAAKPGTATEPKQSEKENKTKSSDKTKKKDDQNQETNEQPKKENNAGSDFSPDFDRDPQNQSSGGLLPKSEGEDQPDFSVFATYPAQGEGSASPAGYPSPVEGPIAQPGYPLGDDGCGASPWESKGACLPNQMPWQSGNAFPLQ